MIGRALLYIPKSIVHRWLTVLVTFVLVNAAVVPAIWLPIKPRHVVTAAIHIAPSLTNVLTGEPDQGEISNYDNYMNTQATLVTSGPVLQKVADDLVDRNLSFFATTKPTSFLSRLAWTLQGKQPLKEPVKGLEAAIAGGTILVERLPDTEFIGITMKHLDEPEARLIVDSLMRQFETSHSADAQQARLETLVRLEKEERELADKIQRQQREMARIAREQGTSAFDGRTEMETARQNTLAAELTRLEVQRLGLEARVAALASDSDSNVASIHGQPQLPMPESIDLHLQRERYVYADPLIQAWTQRLAEVEVDHVVAQTTEPNEAAALDKHKQVLATLKQRLKERCQQRQSEFDDTIADAVREQRGTSLRRARMELDEVKAYEARLHKVLSMAEPGALRIGRASVDYRRLQQDLDVDRELYSGIQRRLKQAKFELDGPPRLRIAYPAEFKEMEDQRWRLTIVAGLVGLALGTLLAVIRGPDVGAGRPS